jgi:hypothetical protein
MPVVLDDYQFDEWMAWHARPSGDGFNALSWPIEVREVGAAVGNTKDAPELMERVGLL